MPDVHFFFSTGDPSLPRLALERGYTLVVEKHYSVGEDLVVLSGEPGSDADRFGRFYILPEKRFLSEFSIDEVEKEDGSSFRFIMDRIGAASIDLIIFKWPVKGEVCVGSLTFQARTYPTEDLPLEPRPPSFAKAYRRLASYIKKSAQRVPNEKTPWTVYIFPEAMALLREDISRSPWDSIRLAPD